MVSSVTKPTSELRAVIALAALYISRMLGLFLVLPVLVLAGPEYGSDDIFLLGVALGVYGLTQAFLQIPFGLLSDRFGRKALIIIGLVVFMVGSLIAATAEGIYGLIIGRALQGAGAIAGVIMATVSDVTSEKNRTKAMAAIGASIGMAFSLALVLGPLFTTHGGVRAIFFVAAGLTVAGIFITLLFIPSHHTLAQSTSTKAIDPSGWKSGLKIVLKDHDLMRLNVGIFILHMIMVSLFLVFPTYLLNLGVEAVNHSWVYLAIMMIAFIVMIPLMILGERKKKLKVVFIATLVTMTCVLILLTLMPKTLPVILIGMLIFFIGFNYLEATLPSLMSKTVPVNHRGAGSGVFSTCQFAGAALGGILGGWVFNQWGGSSVFLVSAFAVLTWCWFVKSMKVPVARSAASDENMVACPAE